jgi:SAM-dependent methyltransferase
VTYWDDLAHHADTSEIWMAHPLVRAAINRRVTGDADVWPFPAVLKGRRFKTALSIGCGTGGLERALRDSVDDITGIDASDAILEEARRLGPGIRYIAADAREFLRGKTFDAIFFHQSLHHFDRLDELLTLVAGATGTLVLDEYIGPSRHEWNVFRLLGPNFVYRMLPPGTRRAKLVRAPINREDPTEAIRSSDIVPAVEHHFRIDERRDYGGHLLSLLYPNMKRDSPRFDEAVSQLIAAEERTLTQSFYAVIVATK